MHLGGFMCVAFTSSGFGCLTVTSLALFAGLFPAANWAADEPARFAVAGAVRDPSGYAIAGAAVVLTPRNAGSAALQGTTAADGSFRLENVLAGPYRLEIVSEGFEMEQQRVQVGQALGPLDIKLRLAHLEEEVTVNAHGPGRIAAEPSQNQDALRLDRDLLDGLPVMDRDILSAAAQFLDDSVLGSGGVSLVVDGMETDVIGVSASAIEEVRLNADPYSAEFSRPGRGRIEVITKEGAKDYHGSLSFLMRDYRFDARNAFAQQRPKQQRRSYEGHFTGPLGKSGKNTFLLSAEHDEDDEEAVVFARTPGGLVRETVPQPQRETEFSARLNRYASEKHTFSASYSAERERQISGVGGFELPDAAYQARQRQHRFYFGHKWILSPQWFTDFSIRVNRERESIESAQPGLRRIIVEDAFTAGGAQQDDLQRQTEFELAYISSWSRGKHFLRAGFLVPDGEHETLDQRNNFDGTYRFASLADFEAGRAFSFSQRLGESRLTFSNYQIAGFVQDDIRLRSNVTLGLGLRYDHVSFLEDATNFAPRMSLAWAFGKSRATVLRAGAGIFHDRVSSSILSDRLLFDGRTQRDIVIANPSYPDPTTGSGNLTEVAPNLVRFAPGLRLPYLTQVSFGVERELRRSLTLAVNYTWVRGTKLFRSLDRNAPLPPEFERPDAAFGHLRELESSGTQKSHGLSVDLRGRLGIFRGAVLYRWGRSYNDTGVEEELTPNSYDLRGQWARANFDRRHRLRLLGTFDLPWELELGTIFSVDSGRPYDLTIGQDFNRDGRAIERPEGVGRNALEEPGQAEVDLRLAREFKLRPVRTRRS
jgi:outer membrane receptor protein involved in Fe transport